MKSCMFILMLTVALSFSACGGSGSTTTPPPVTYTISGTVQGLSGTGLVLQNNAGNNLPVSANAAFTFTTPVSGAYNVTVLTQPSNPAQSCAVSNGSGTASANVASVQVACVGEWAWAGGSQLVYQPGTYGSLGSADPSNVPGGRDSAVSWTDATGNLWLFGGELIYDTGPTNGLLNDLWKYNPSLGEWTWMSGSNTADQSGTYGTLAKAAPSNVPGARWGSVTWTDASGDFWLFGGAGYDATGAYGALNDLWKYSASEWTWMSGATTTNQSGTYGTQGTAAPGNVPGARGSAVTWTDKSGNFWLFGGGGYDSTGTSGDLNDLWKYNASTSQWTWIGGSNVVNQRGTYGSQGTVAPSNVPGARFNAASVTDAAGNFWLFGGVGYDSTGTVALLNDLWKYGAGEWTWMSGSNMIDQIGTYGIQGIAAPDNVPGARFQATSWSDPGGNLWFFGGAGFDSKGNSRYLNDLWKYSAGQWTWVGGSDIWGVWGIYGTQGLPAPSSAPGSRQGPPVQWTDAAGNFWLFGGYGLGNGTTSGLGDLNDLWKYEP